MTTDQVIHVVDDDRLFLAALKRTLSVAGLEVRMYTGANAFLDSFDPQQPGCLITDLRMPGMGGLELQRRLKEMQVRLPIIFITGHGNASTAVTALKCGAIDFLEKPFSEKDLMASVQLALEKDLNDRRLAREQALVQQRFSNLSPREQQVFALVVSDLPNKKIARDLMISPRTVEHHREHLMLKMHAHSTAELITMAVLCGIHELHLCPPPLPG
ncbi:response regulator transcription factor [Pseudomonas sp. NA-150]|uniref:response regulator transcription factor n=1 Tax=Pseudomonas sp. NA-150 TaxID=3367525 RepID=UPI0037C6B955